MIVPFDGKRRIRRELFARFVDTPSSAADDPGEDPRLCLGPAFRETPLDEKLVGPALCNFERRHGVAELSMYAGGRGGKIGCLRRKLGAKAAHRNFVFGAGIQLDRRPRPTANRDPTNQGRRKALLAVVVSLATTTALTADSAPDERRPGHGFPAPRIPAMQGRGPPHPGRLRA